MLVVWLALLAIGIWSAVQLVNYGASPMIIALLIGTATIGVLILGGFYLINPNEAAAIQLFGSYKSTDRTPGLRWVLPWLSRKKIAVRANNVISDKLGRGHV